ncbi:hypothetical protein MJ1HA_1153 [Metallosphaera sedula]|nr:hypothetical protein MJ1HA_1153 [Metallosphaera sedula]
MIGLIWLVIISCLTRAYNALSITDHLVYMLLISVIVTGI